MYTFFYKLKEEPFQLTPDPRFLYLAESHRAALNVLIRGVLRRRGFIVATGPVGTGKTTLLHAALQILSDTSLTKNRIAAAFLVNPTLSREEFLEALVEEFEVTCTSTSKPHRLAALHAMLLDTQKLGGTTALFIDEAHLLSPELLEEIRLLSNAETYGEKLIQVILCGQPEFLTLLARPELRALQQRIAGTCMLHPLTRAETRTYIAGRLHAAQLKGSSPFVIDSLEAIYAYTQGIPRLINLLCDECLCIGFRTKRNQVQLDMVEEAAMSLGLAESAMRE